MNPPPLRAPQAILLHDAALAAEGWPGDETLVAQVITSGLAPGANGELPVGEGLWHWVMTNHRYNGLLWAQEDLARRTTVGDAEIAANKRAIDRYNQARNDATERVDELLLLALGLVDEATARSDAPLSRVPEGSRLNSETAGSILDRMSIMALKIHAMRGQTQREDVDEAHRQASLTRWQRLREQREDLGRCLDALLADAAAGRAHFKVYRQFKMYNDPRFNPVLVAERRARGL